MQHIVIPGYKRNLLVLGAKVINSCGGLVDDK